MNNKKLKMKSFYKLSGIIVLSALLLFSITACGDEEETKTTPSPYLGEVLQIQNVQVWKHNNTFPIALKAEYSHFEESLPVTVTVRLQDNNVWYSEIADSFIDGGGIIDGILNISGGTLLQTELLDWSYWKIYFSEWDAAIDNEVKGNIIIIYAGEAARPNLNKEKPSGTEDSIWLESILFAYMEDDCHVTGLHGKEGFKDGDSFYHAIKDLDLPLKKGWNTLCRKQTYTSSGFEDVSIVLANPNDFKWVIYQ